MIGRKGTIGTLNDNFLEDLGCDDNARESRKIRKVMEANGIMSTGWRSSMFCKYLAVRNAVRQMKNIKETISFFAKL